MKGNQRNFRSVMSLMLSFLPNLDKWQFAGRKLYPDPRRSRGTVDRYAGMHPRRDHPHTQEMARRVRQGLV